MICSLPFSIFAVTTPGLRGGDAAEIHKSFSADGDGYYFTLFQNAKTNVQVTATTYNNKEKFGVVQCDAPVEPSPFGHTSAEYFSIDPQSGTTTFMLQDSSGFPTTITKTGAGLFSICPDNDPSTKDLITENQVNDYKRFCN